MAAYEDAAYPNAAVINVPALEPGETFDHVLEFWGGLVWGAGTYELTLTADAGDAVAEDDEGNNQASAEKQQLAGVNKTPTPKGPGTIVLKPKSSGGGGFPFELQFTLGQ
jgi:subtilase family serine protease